MSEWFNKLNTTSFRIVATVGMVYLTGLRYLASGMGIPHIGHVDVWKPSIEWLVFLCTLAGVDSAVLIGKRVTDHDYQRIKSQAKQPDVKVENANVQVDGNLNASPVSDGSIAVVTESNKDAIE